PAGVRAGGSDVQVFEVKEVLAEGKAAAPLKPARSFALDGYAVQMLLSTDGSWLYTLDALDGKKAKVVRWDASTGKAAGEAFVKEQTDCLCMSRDGTSLYAGSHEGKRDPNSTGPSKGTVQRLDAETMKVEKTVAVPTDPYEIDATDEGIVFVSSGSGGNK